MRSSAGPYELRSVEKAPTPFTFTCRLDGKLIAALVGTEGTTEEAERAGERSKLLNWIRSNGPATKTDMRKAGFSWRILDGDLEALVRSEMILPVTGKRAGSLEYALPSQTLGWKENAERPKRRDGMERKNGNPK